MAKVHEVISITDTRTICGRDVGMVEIAYKDEPATCKRCLGEAASSTQVPVPVVVEPPAPLAWASQLTWDPVIVGRIDVQRFKLENHDLVSALGVSVTREMALRLIVAQGLRALETGPAAKAVKPLKRSEVLAPDKPKIKAVADLDDDGNMSTPSGWGRTGSRERLPTGQESADGYYKGLGWNRYWGKDGYGRTLTFYWCPRPLGQEAVDPYTGFSEQNVNEYGIAHILNMQPATPTGTSKHEVR